MWDMEWVLYCAVYSDTGASCPIGVCKALRHMKYTEHGIVVLLCGLLTARLARNIGKIESKKKEKK